MITCILDETTYNLPRYRIRVEMPEGGESSSIAPPDADYFEPGDQPYASLAVACRNTAAYLKWTNKRSNP